MNEMVENDIYRINGIFKSIRNMSNAIKCSDLINSFRGDIEKEIPFKYVLYNIRFYVEEGKFVYNEDPIILFKEYVKYLNNVRNKLALILDNILSKNTELFEFLAQHSVFRNTDNDIVESYFKDKLLNKSILGNNKIEQIDNSFVNMVTELFDAVPSEPKDDFVVEYGLFLKKDGVLVDPVYVNYFWADDDKNEIYDLINNIKILKCGG